MKNILIIIGLTLGLVISFDSFSATSTPTAYSATNVGTTSFTARWSNHNLFTYRTRYTLQVSTNSSFTNVLETYSLLGATSQSVTGLSPGQTYYYRVMAQYVFPDTGMPSDAASGWSNTTSTTTLTPPSSPNQPTLESMNGSAFTVNWGAVNGATEYEVRYVSQGLNTFTHVTSNLEYQFIHRHPSAEVETIPSRLYQVSVRAINTNGTSGYSSALQVTTTPPPPYLNDASGITSSSFEISWSSPSAGSNYEVDVSEHSNFSTLLSQYNSKPVTGTSTTISGLQSYKTYYYRVRSVNSSGSSLNTGSKSATTLLSNPNQPTLESMNGSAFTVNWGAVNGATEYEVRYVSQGLNTFTHVTSNLEYQFIHRHPSAEVETIPSRLYQVSVRAINTNGTSGYSSALQVTTTPPPPYLNDASGITSSSFEISWSSPSAGSNYEVDVSEHSNFSTLLSQYNSKPVTGTSTTISGLQSNKTYYYRVRSVNSSGSSSNTGSKSATTLLSNPNQPTLESMNGAAFTVNWGAVNGATEYEVRYVSQGLNTFTHVTSNLEYQFIHRHPSAEVETIPSRLYQVSVRAINTNGTSGYSSALQVTTTPPPPYLNDASGITSSSFEISWSSPSAGSNYEVDVSEHSNFSTLLSQYNSKPVTGTSTTISGLQSYKTYYYRVRSVNSSGSSLNTGSKSATTLLSNPNQPTLESMNGAAFTVNWGAVNGATEYEVRYVSQGLNTFTHVTSNLEYQFIHRHPSAEVETIPSRLYQVSVRAINTNGTSGYSSALQVTTTPPPPYLNDASGITSSSFEISWSSPSAGSNYEVDVSEHSNFSTLLSQYNSKPVTGTSTTISGLQSYKTYYYRVRSVNSSGSSSNTGSKSATTLFYGASSTMNYILSLTPQAENQGIIPLPVNQVQASIDYFDGLGRIVQQVSVRGTPDYQDLVKPISYDQFGRSSIDYLPYPIPSESGAYQSNALRQDNYTLSDHYDYYKNQSVYMSSKAFSETKYELSPINRPLKQGSPGVAWQPDPDPQVITDKVIHYDYESNSILDAVLLFETEDLGDKQLYVEGTLYKNTTTDEDGNKMVEYTNKRGQVVLKESSTEDPENPWAATYYIYDDFDQLRVVLPPEASSRLDAEFFGQTLEVRQAFLDRWAFQYEYDGRRRMTSKKVPGAAEMTMVYDRWDRLVLTQDGNQQDSRQWLFTKYDHLNRPVMTGLVDHYDGIADDVKDPIRVDRSESFTGSGETLYSNSTTPSTGTATHHTITYYDDYAFRDHSELNTVHGHTGFVTPQELSTASQVDAFHLLPEDQASVKGQVTGTKTKLLGTSEDEGDGYLETITYYDNKYRVIQVVSENHLGGIDVISTQYDFVGNVRRVHSTHSDGTNTMEQLLEYEYDHANRLMSCDHTLNEDDPVRLYTNEYNELGELVKKHLHQEQGSTDHAQTIDYDYNIRGWLKSINESGLSGSGDAPEPADLFHMELIYNAPFATN